MGKNSFLTKTQLIMIVVLLAGAAISVINQTSISPMLPVIMDELSVSSPTAQWLVSGFALVSALVIPITAYLMKRFTTRAVFFASMGLFILGCVLCFIAPNFPVLMIGRICQAACAGILMPLATNIMLLVFPPEKRGFAMGIYSLITCLMPALGPSVAGGLADTVGWRLVYVIMLALSAGVTIFAAFSLKNFGESERISLDVPSVILSALGLVALLYGISSIGDMGFTPFTGGLIAVGVAIIALFTFRQTRLSEPMLNMVVFKYRRFVIGLVIVMIVMLVCMAPSVTVPLVIQQGLGESATVSGLMNIPAAVFGAITALTAGRLFDRMGGRPLAIVGAIILLVAYVGCALMMPEYGVVWLAVCMALSNVGMMFVNTPLNTWALGFLPDELIPHGNAMSNTLRQVCMSISTTLFVTVMAIATSTSGAVTPQAAVVDGARFSFACEAVFCVIVMVLILAFVKPGEKAEFTKESVDPVNSKASDFMRIQVPFLTEKSSIREAMTLFNNEGVTDMPVIDEKGRVIAFLSSSDIMKQLVERQIMAPDLNGWAAVVENETMHGRLAEIIDRNVMGIATKNVVTVDADDSFQDVCAILAQKRFKKVPVIQDGKLAGTINRDDVVHHIMKVLADTGM